MNNNVIVDVTISNCSCSVSRTHYISAGLTNVSGLAVAAFDFGNCSLSAVRFVFVLYFRQLLS